jgi:pimeloyl-ACP methyl ester carboxylesterase
MLFVLGALALAMFSGSPVPAQPAHTDHDVTLPSGVRLHYVELGPAGGPAVIMLHGYTDASFSFSRVWPLMPPGVRVIVPDQRGHGGSGRAASYTMDDMATDALELMTALKIDRATVVGHSMGSFVARRMAVLAPERVTRLVLVGAGPSARNAAVTELRTAVEGLRDPVAHGFVRDFQVSTVNRAVPPEFMARAIAESERVPASVWKGAIAGLMDYRGGERKITAPTLILGGDRDGVFSVAEHEELARLIPGARAQIFPGIGHALHWEDPKSFVDALLAFLPGRS